jgi:hypothetical protein
MKSVLRPDYLDDFIKVAQFICGGDPPIWLAEQLWRWNGSVYHDLHVEGRHVEGRHIEGLRPTRTKMRSDLQEIENAALLLADTLAPSWAVRTALRASGSKPTPCSCRRSKASRRLRSFPRSRRQENSRPLSRPVRDSDDSMVDARSNVENPLPTPTSMAAIRMAG